jgi:hypothetical protein
LSLKRERIDYNGGMAIATEREKRARERARWPVRKFKLGEEPEDDLSATTTPAERLAMVWPLTVQAWTLAGRTLPVYERSTIPVRIYRDGERPPDDDVSS